MLSHVNQDEARRVLADTVALWSAGAETPEAVVRCACDALVAGLDSDGLRTLAGLSTSASTWDVEDVVPLAAAELGIETCPPRTEGASLQAARVLARRCLAGAVQPRELVAWMHTTFVHGQSDRIEPLLVLDDEYDISMDTDRSIAFLDQEVLDAARALLGD
jgi:hypothetical protein